MYKTVNCLLVILLGIATLSASPSVHAADEDVLKFRQDRVRLRADAYLEEGKNDVRRGNYLKGIRMLSQAIAKGVGSEGYLWRGKGYYLTGMYGEAISDMHKVVNLSPSDPSSHTLLADMYAAKGDYGTALKNYEKAIRIDPLYVGAYIGRGIAFVAFEKYGPALKDFQTAIQNDPRNPSYLTNMAFACLAADMPLAAREFLQKALPMEQSEHVRRVLETRIAAIDSPSDFERKIGGVEGYLTKISDTYEALPHVAFLDVPGDSPQEFARGPLTKDSRPTKPGLSAISTLRREASGRKINVGEAEMRTGFSGRWDGIYMGLKWNIDFKVAGNVVSAILKIYSPSGKEDVHHCEGIIKEDGFLEASDNKGFRFSGRVTDDFRVVGTVTSPDGKTVTMDMPVE